MPLISSSRLSERSTLNVRDLCSAHFCLHFFFSCLFFFPNFSSVFHIFPFARPPLNAPASIDKVVLVVVQHQRCLRMWFLFRLNTKRSLSSWTCVESSATSWYAQYLPVVLHVCSTRTCFRLLHAEVRTGLDEEGVRCLSRKEFPVFHSPVV